MHKISNIQKYSVHDGEGIRTTVFFKGCPLSCKWCHNPETLSYKKQLLFYKDRCVDCKICRKFDCSVCVACGKCVECCAYDAREILGKDFSVKELIKELAKDLIFYETSGGGVTLSGGEVMTMNMDFIEKLLTELTNLGIRINIDTCGYAPFENFLRVLPYTECFLYDIKIMNSDMHKVYTGVHNELILENLIKLSRENVLIDIRIPIIKNISGTSENISGIIEFLTNHAIKPNKIYLLPYHNTAKGKYEKLGIESNLFEKPTKVELEEYLQMLILAGFNACITQFE